MNSKFNFKTFVTGLTTGIIFFGILTFLTMPSMMIKTLESNYDFDTTVSKIEAAIKREGWSHKGTSTISEELEKHNMPLKGRVKTIKLCKAEYAKAVLDSDKYVSVMMPCQISVWERDDKKVMISKMNLKLMGKMFGGVIADVMSGKVSSDEARMLEGVYKN
jgi:uncharacterized protein (DUF302 family)